MGETRNGELIPFIFVGKNRWTSARLEGKAPAPMRMPAPTTSTMSGAHQMCRIVLQASIAALLLATGAVAATIYSTYWGRVGNTGIVAVLEFRDDRTVTGAYIRELDLNLESKDPFPIRRLHGRNTSDGVVQLEITLRGNSLGRVLLTRHKDGESVLWSGVLKDGGPEDIPVALQRMESRSGPALIN